jgi:hypothetical protein
MNNTFKLIITSLLIIIPSMSFAFFCPTNFNQIDFGMTMEQVTQSCGKPVDQTETIKENDNVPQEWNYYIAQTVSMGGSTPNAQGTLKTSVVFDDKGKAINISVNGIGLGQSTICGSNIQLGDTKESIKSACGSPSFISKQPLDPATAPPPTKIIQFNYTNVTPKVILIFENGKLTDKK